MSNGARHTWGFFVGVVLTAALAGLLIFGSYRLQHGYAIQFHKQDKWIGGGLIAARGHRVRPPRLLAHLPAWAR